AGPAAAKQPEFATTPKNGPGTSVHSGSIYATGAAELKCPRMRGTPRAPFLADRFRIRRKATLPVGDSVALGSACATRRKREDEDAGRSREEKIICPPGHPIQVFIPLRAKRRGLRPKRSPTSPPAIPTGNPPTEPP